MNYKNTATLCMINYFYDYGYKHDIQELIDMAKEFNDCNDIDLFMKKIEDLNIVANIEDMSIEQIKANENLPVFAICKFNDEEAAFLPIYRVYGDYIVTKDEKLSIRRIHKSFFNKYYQGKVIQITDNKKFLKQTFLKQEYKKYRLFSNLLILQAILIVGVCIFLWFYKKNEESFEKWVGFIILGVMAIITIVIFVLTVGLTHYHSEIMAISTKSRELRIDSQDNLDLQIKHGFIVALFGDRNNDGLIFQYLWNYFIKR